MLTNRRGRFKGPTNAKRRGWRAQKSKLDSALGFTDAVAEAAEAIMRHPGVRLAAVLAVEDDLRGEEVLAYVVPGDGVSRDEVSPAVLSDFCAERLARFKVPRYRKYRDDLPRTPSERIRKEALREEGEDPTTGAWDRVEERRR